MQDVYDACPAVSHAGSLRPVPSYTDVHRNGIHDYLESSYVLPATTAAPVQTYTSDFSLNGIYDTFDKPMYGCVPGSVNVLGASDFNRTYTRSPPVYLAPPANTMMQRTPTQASMVVPNRATNNTTGKTDRERRAFTTILDFDVKAEYVDENLPLPLTSKELGVYRIEVPPQTHFTSLLCFVYLVAGTTMKDQIDIKVSTFLRNVCEEERVEEHTQVVDSCDTQASNTVQVLTLATSAKLAHYQRHKGWCDTELTTNTQTKAEKTATVEKLHATVDELKVSMENLVEEEKSDVIERNIIELDEKFYIKFAQFEQQQKEMDRNTMKTINVRTDQSKRKIVIRTPPEDAAQCFDVTCENAMAKMENSPISQCLYLHKTENEADPVESEFYSLIIAECQRERIFLDHADLEMSIGNVEQCRKIYRKYSWNRTVKIRDEHLQTEDQNS